MTMIFSEFPKAETFLCRLSFGGCKRKSTCDYITKGESVLITGATGCGKGFIASALGNHACINGKNVAYYNAQKLLTRIKMARLDGRIMKFFDKLAK